jgi:hypothetical protein
MTDETNHHDGGAGSEAATMPLVEPDETSPHGAPVATDPQAGMLTDDPGREPDSAQPLHPETGEPFGP